ncbi:hypothetical protein VTN31DRAFT_6041 [Thermomyces dupontii]|uniref:uncharacterized protein n=1 Tax=Talaromyces thermophilus TaxID=28565 RepID=UPI003743EC45
MSGASIPDAWDDDWEKIADKADASPPPEPEKKIPPKVAKAQRRAAQAEFNRQLWAEAESPQTFHFLESTKSDIPLKSEFKPAVKVLSRRPQVIARQASSVVAAGSETTSATTAGLARLALADDGLSDDDHDDASEASNKPPEMTPEERQAKALRDREEKQRKYEEVRERLFGTSSSNPGSGTSSPARSGSATPPRQGNNGNPNSNNGNDGGHRGRGRSRGAGRGDRSRYQGQLYDPNYSQKPNSVFLQRRDRQGSSASAERAAADHRSQSPRQQQPIRTPRNPENSARGGFGFHHRGRGTGSQGYNQQHSDG